MQNETQRSKNDPASGGGTLRRRLFPRRGGYIQRRTARTASAGVGQKRRTARRDDRGVPLRENGEQRALIASTTKIMTGLLVCEAGELDRTVTVPDAAVGLEGSSMYLKRMRR